MEPTTDHNISSKRPRQGPKFLWDLGLTVLSFLKLPLALVLATTIFFFITIATVDLCSRILQSRTASLCNLPVLPHLGLCTVDPSPMPSALDRADFSSLVHIQSVALDHLVDRATGGADLALNLKHAELAVKDLVVVVRMSNVTVRYHLAETLTTFAIDAKNVGRGLQRLSAMIHSAVDSIGSYNTYALRTIEAAQGKDEKELRATILRTFQSSFDGFSSQIARVILEAADAAAALDLLENRLFAIHELCAHETFLTSVALDSLLWELWSILGGNHGRKLDLRHRAAVLQEVERCGSVALAYVAATAQTVIAIDAQLSELRDRLTEYAVNAQEVPVEVQLASIERSLHRLRDIGRTPNAHIGIEST